MCALTHRALSRCVPIAAAALLLVLFLGTPPACADKPRLTDAEVDEAISEAVTWLKAQRHEFGHWERGTAKPDDLHYAGSTALALLALLYAEEEPRTQFMQDSLFWLKGQEPNGTYVYGTRAHLLALLAGKSYRELLERDLDWLLNAPYPPTSEHPGCYDYKAIPPDATSGRWDHSVSQFGVLGVWMATDAGLRVPDEYWERVGQHWIDYQNVDGGWGYQVEQESTGSMTAAGVATLYVVLDQRYAANPRAGGALLPAIERGMRRLSMLFSEDQITGQWRYYYLYSVERVGRASGHKYLDRTDWFQIGGRWVLEQQREDGSWRGTGEWMNDVRNTCFALMFLCHGRAPLLFNKLEHGPDWDTRLRDVAGLTRYAGHTFERLLNWQIVTLEGPVTDLFEAPVLYLYGAEKWPFTDTQVNKIREYAERGGLIFAVVGQDGDAFRKSMTQLARDAFPDHPLRPVTADHPLVNGDVQFPLDSPPPMVEVHNGVRTLMLLCQRDVARSWNLYDVRGPELKDFHLGANVYLYATDKSTIESRLRTLDIPKREVEIKRKIRIARVRHGGDWNVEPYGWTRLAHYMNNETGTRLLTTTGVPLDGDLLEDFEVAYLAGTQSFELTDDEMRGLRRFLSGGGTLLVDAAGGSREFLRAFERQLPRIRPGRTRVLTADSPIITGAGIPDAANLAGVKFRRATPGSIRAQGIPHLRAVPARSRLAVIYSPLDLSAGLLGSEVYGVSGYDPESALKIMRNLLLYAALPASDKAALERDE
jgi:hypothetical protein